MRLLRSGSGWAVCDPPGARRGHPLPGVARFLLSAWRPDTEALLQDPLYQAFVLPAWQADRRRAETEAQARREAEQQARAEARQEAEQRAAAITTRAEAAEAEVARLKRLLRDKGE